MLSPHARRAILAELEDLASLQLLRLKADLARRTHNALKRQARARQAALQRMHDEDVVLEPFAWGSELSPRARRMNVIEGGE